MVAPHIQLLGPSSGTEIALAWDMPNTFWDGGLFWDSSTFQANKLTPTINSFQSVPKIESTQNRIVIGVS